MKSPPWARRLVPAILGAAMLGVIVFAALTPNIGIVSAQPNAQYNNGNPANTTLEYALIGVLVAAIVAALVGLLIFQRRKRGGRGGAGSVSAWQETQGGPGGPSMGAGGGPGGMAPAGAAGVAGAGAGATLYNEAAPPETGPDWAEPAAPATMGAPAAAPPPMDESEPDIDRLMKELDQISDDILKKTPPKKGGPTDASAEDADK